MQKRLYTIIHYFTQVINYIKSYILRQHIFHVVYLLVYGCSHTRYILTIFLLNTKQQTFSPVESDIFLWSRILTTYLSHIFQPQLFTTLCVIKDNRFPQIINMID